jgi:hypothetical protein
MITLSQSIFFANCSATKPYPVMRLALFVDGLLATLLEVSRCDTFYRLRLASGPIKRLLKSTVTASARSAYLGRLDRMVRALGAGITLVAPFFESGDRIQLLSSVKKERVI